MQLSMLSQLTNDLPSMSQFASIVSLYMHLIRIPCLYDTYTIFKFIYLDGCCELCSETSASVSHFLCRFEITSQKYKSRRNSKVILLFFLALPLPFYTYHFSMTHDQEHDRAMCMALIIVQLQKYLVAINCGYLQC